MEIIVPREECRLRGDPLPGYRQTLLNCASVIKENKYKINCCPKENILIAYECKRDRRGRLRTSVKTKSGAVKVQVLEKNGTCTLQKISMKANERRTSRAEMFQDLLGALDYILE